MRVRRVWWSDFGRRWSAEARYSWNQTRDKRRRAFIVGLLLLSSLLSQTGDVGKDVGVEGRMRRNGLAVGRVVVIGVDEYEDEQIPVLSYCEKDARDIAAALKSAGWSVRLMTMGKKPLPTLPAGTSGDFQFFGVDPAGIGGWAASQAVSGLTQ